MFKWLIKKILKPLIPIILQCNKVSRLSQYSTKQILIILQPNTAIYAKTNALYFAITLITLVTDIILRCMGMSIVELNVSDSNIYLETEKLKGMIDDFNNNK